MTTDKKLYMTCDFDCDGTLTYVKRVTEVELAAQPDPSDWHEISYADYETIKRLLTPNYGESSYLGSGSLPDHASFKGMVRQNEWS